MAVEGAVAVALATTTAAALAAVELTTAAAPYPVGVRETLVDLGFQAVVAPAAATAAAQAMGVDRGLVAVRRQVAKLALAAAQWS